MRSCPVAQLGQCDVPRSSSLRMKPSSSQLLQKPLEMGSRGAVGTNPKSYRSRPVMREEPGPSAGAIPAIARVRQSQGLSRQLPPGVEAVSQVPAAQVRNVGSRGRCAEGAAWLSKGSSCQDRAHSYRRICCPEGNQGFSWPFSRASTKGFLQTSKHASTLSGSHTNMHPPSHSSRGKKGGLKAGKRCEKLGENEWAGKG